MASTSSRSVSTSRQPLLSATDGRQSYSPPKSTSPSSSRRVRLTRGDSSPPIGLTGRSESLHMSREPARGTSSRLHSAAMKSVSLERRLNTQDYTIGILLLLLVVFLWTGSNFLTQDLFEDGYEKPFLVTYLNTSSFAVYLIPFFIGRRYRRVRREARDLAYEPVVSDPELSTIDVQARQPVPLWPGELPPLTVCETAKLSFVFCFFWFTANWTVNVALDFTSVASTTILSSMSGFFTLGFGRLFRVETLTPGKIAAVMVSFSGVLLVSLSDSAQPAPGSTLPPAPHIPPIESSMAFATDLNSAPLLGDALALISAVFYALYVILLKVRIHSESRIDMQLFFGFVGLFNVLAMWPIGLILHWTGMEVFELPSTRKAVTAILINMFITLSSDYIYVLAMLKTTPLVVTVGLSLTIPLAVIGDFLLGKPTRGQVVVGAILVLFSFIAVGLEDSSEPSLEAKDTLEADTISVATP